MKTIKDCKDKEEIIKWIKEIERLSTEHWELLDKYGYVDFPRNKSHPDCYSFKLKGVLFSCWHEGDSYMGAIDILKLLFEIKEEDLE